ncbi:MAG: hypothetical protein Q8N63_08200, partial [Nanoarchaeota archaeon]|nr:hypothetical protein [Nanoarchaeota archaeon]
MKFLSYYSRKEILKELVEIAKDREIQVWFDKIPGQRPDMINFEGDILASAKRGMSSMHVSEERWTDALKLKSGMTKTDLDSFRKGWDLILDIDCKRLEYSRLAAVLLIDALRFNSVKNISVKFSGNTGFHIGVPFEAFPEKVNNIKIKDLFPNGPRMIAVYLKEIIREHLIAKFMELDKDLDVIAKKFGKTKKDILVEGRFNPYSILDIDSVLISSRHMIRAPYSINEKTGLVSLPLNYEDIPKFNLLDARPENVKVDVRFLDREDIISGSAKHLVLQAFDFCEKRKEDITTEKKNFDKFEIPKEIIDFKKFPPCIVNCLKGLKEDGRKRAVFIMINFLRHMGYDFDKIKTILLEWNVNNYEKLREGYIISQISWFKMQKNLILPPNCDN